MEELIQYIKGKDEQADRDFKNKKKYGNVYYYGNNLFVKKGLKWFYFPLSEIVCVELIHGTRQLRQCCGAPIYKTKELLITTCRQQHVYLHVEEVENMDLKRAEALIEEMMKTNCVIKYLNI